MKTKQNMRRLVALTLATAVTLPQAGNVFAASTELGRASANRLEQLKLTTASDGKGKLTTKDRFPLLSLPRTFQHEIMETTAVTKTGMESSRSLSEKMDPGVQNGTTPLPIMVTNGNNKLQIVTKADEPSTETTGLVTEIDEENEQSLAMAESPPETGELPSASPPESGGEEAAVDNRKTVETEGITDVTTSVPDGGENPLSGGVVMPPEAGEPSPETDTLPDETEKAPEQGETPPVPDENVPENGEEPPSGEASAPDGEGELSADEAELPPDASAMEPEILLPEGIEGLAPETPTLQALDEALTLTGERRIYNYSVGYGVPLLAGTGDHLGLKDYEEVKDGIQYGRFQLELPENVSQAEGVSRSDYGSRIYSSDNRIGGLNGLYGVWNGKYYDDDPTDPSDDGYDLTLGDDSGVLYSYCILPSVSALGRVPDKTFAGWYVYSQGAKSNSDGDGTRASLVREWYYGDTTQPMWPVDVDDYGPEDPDYTVDDDAWDFPPYTGRFKPVYGDNSDLGGTWDGARDYSEYGYDYDTAAKKRVSLVGRWKASDESRAADIGVVKEETQYFDGDGLPLKVEYSDLDSAVTLTAGGQRLQLYSGDIVGKYGPALEALKTDFDRGGEPGEGTEYWLRVPANVDSLDLVFNAAEIFYDYISAADKSNVVSPVRITGSYGREEKEYSRAGVEGSTFTWKMLPSEWYDIDNGYRPIPMNGEDNPAYSRWTVTGITLKNSTVGEEGYLYNDITIAVTSPSGETTTTYTFHVQRLTEPTLSQAPGNTPMGMIARDTRDATQFDRAAAEKIFTENYQFSHKPGEYPGGSVNNGGVLFRDRYVPRAWNEAWDDEWARAGIRKVTNIDLDPKAIVVYQNSAFQDPGITLTDAEGRPVQLGAGTGKECIVYRKLKLRTAEELTIPNLTGGTVCWYKGGELVDGEGNALSRTSDTPTGEVLTSATSQIDLRGLKVLPGIYQIEYEIFDPVAGETYGWDKSKAWVTEKGEESESFLRTLVVLPIPGDVDMDGAVTSADAEVLRNYLTDAGVTSGVDQDPKLDGTVLGTNPTVDLFAYRVANMDHDDTLDKHIQNSDKTTDVDLLEALPRIQLDDEENNKSDYYYLPLPNTVETKPREKLKTSSGAEGAKLKLVYLGKEGARTVDEDHVDGYFTAPNGPWKNGGKEIPTTIGENDPNRMQLFDTMWVGVKLSDAAAEELLKKDVDTFTFSLVYDMRYLQPASVLSAGLWKDTAEERWRTTLELYNMGGASETVWGKDNSYSFTRATQSARSFSIYDTKAITPLETAADAEGRSTHLRELVFSVTLNGGGTAANLSSQGDQWLLAAPFILVQYPLGIEEKRGYQGVEMQAGMSDFTLIFQEEDGGVSTAAYNAMEEHIFGGRTQNLATCVTYANAGPEVPLGKDTSEVLYIRHEPLSGSTSKATDIVYSTEFRAQHGWKKNPDGTWADEVVRIPTSAIVRYAPDWLHYERVSGTIWGRPEAAGVYNFSIANYRYELVVEKATIHYWADSQSSYYGEEEFRSREGKDYSEDYTFRYDPMDIKSIETERAAELGLRLTEVEVVEQGQKVVRQLTDGLGADLERLLADEKYTGPKFMAVDRNEAAVKTTTVASANAYPIRSTLAQSSNYVLEYTAEPGEGARGLTILQRPLQVIQFEDMNVGRIYSDQSGNISNKRVTLDNRNSGKEEFQVALADPLDNDREGEYDGRPLKSHEGYKAGVLLPGDSLILQYQAELLQTPEDIQGSVGGNRYILAGVEETRVAHISGLRIVGGVNWESYSLENGEPSENDRDKVVGTVRRRNVIRFNIVGVPPLEYAAGDQLRASDALRFYIQKESDGAEVREGIYPYNEQTTFAEHGVRVTWATEEEKAAGLPGTLEYHNSQVLTKEFDGRYLCLSTENGTGGRIVTYYETPLRITSRNLVLTAAESSRFYGEENGTLRFTYDPTQLSAAELERLRGRYGEDAASRGPRDGSELEYILAEHGYTSPTLRVMDTDDRSSGEVTTKSAAGKNTYVVRIEGAKCADGGYTIQYSYTYTQDGKRYTVTQEGWGATPFQIRRRPIVVEGLRKTAATENLVTLYADTKRIFKTDLKLTMADVVISLPENDENGASYYPRYGATEPTRVEMAYQVKDPIIEGDVLTFTYRGTVAPTDGMSYVHWTSFSKGHFDMDPADENGDRRYPVQVEDLMLSLDNSAAGNYELVYKDNTSARLGTPAQWEPVTNCIEPGVNAGMTYYVPRILEEKDGGTLEKVDTGWGTVTLRPIEKIVILSTGKLVYTYGETYAPNQPEANQRLGLQIHIEYKSEPEDILAKNVTSGELDFRVTSYTVDGSGNRVPVTTFDERGLEIYYQPGGQTTDAASCRGLTYQSALSQELHDGKYLVVAGKRGSQRDLVWSQPSAAPLTIRPRTLTLRATDQYRAYGEDNPGSFPFSFDVRQLAPQDQAKLGAASGTLDGSRLSALGLTYTAPVFGTAAVKKSPVKDSGHSGYGISLRTEGKLANYQLEYEPGTLYIYPRRVQVDRFFKNPIYTIYSDLDDHIVHDNISINADKTDFSLKLPSGQYWPDGSPRALPMSGPALVAGDEMTLRVEVAYPNNWKSYNGTNGMEVTVQNVELLPDMEGYGNYVLEMAGNQASIAEEARKATGTVKLRQITSIRIQRSPLKTVYSYGETLDLTGLVVNIVYQNEGSEGEERTTIPYEYTDQFAAQGLYVNYYPYPELQAADNTPQGRANLRNKYYTAATGDHVTIAPTHNSMTKAVGDPKREFAANGQYLVVTAQRKSQFGDSHEAAEPVLVRDGDGVGELVQIRVNPRPLQFYLEADDKTYDATTKATGTLRFDNAFRQMGQVDATNENVTDMVYPVTGANYEEQWGQTLTAAGDQDFSAYIARNGYRFTTGAEGYQYGKENTMTFSFMDPNVAYATEPSVHDVYGVLTTKEVQVKGLRLAGADAANYELRVTEVTGENAAGIRDYLNSGHALPRATIQKADREPMSLDILPTVAVDPNTNVVRVIYNQSKANIVGGEEEQYRDELHFEYALQYVEGMASGEEPTDPELPGDPESPAEEATLVVEQLAGMANELLWWDETFHGGETVTVEYPEEYLPKKEDIPTESSVGSDSLRKGQVYAWAEVDARFILDGEAYPGGTVWPGYDLYQTEREPLDRDRVYWPVVRVAETHNYNASPAISSVREYTPEMIQAVLDAQEALRNASGDQGSTAAAQRQMTQAAEVVMAAMGEAEAAARLASQRESARLTEIAKSGNWPENWTGRAPAAAVKTYAQRLELVSVAEMEGQKISAQPPQTPQTRARADEEGEKYQVPTLEAVWFTDILEYGEQQLLDAVVRNLTPVRYQDYAWDSLMSAPLFSDGKGLSLKEPFQVTVTEKDEQGREVTAEVLVNQDHSARIYVDLKQNSSGGTVQVSSLRIDSDDLIVQLGAEPVQLRVILTPSGAYTRMVQWSSSDESVAIVDRNGVVSFVGVGVAVITATSVEGLLTGNLSDSITVTVRPKDGVLEGLPNSIFNVEMQEPFFQLEEGAMLFHPQWEMTRGEAAQLLVRFYVENPAWTRTGPQDFPDLTGEEGYASAARLLGSLGVVMGLPDGRFGGEQNITRAEFVVLLTRMLGIEVPDTTGASSHAFLDTGEEDTWAYREIDAMVTIPGFVMGTGEGYFTPGRPITRAEAAVFLTRLLQFPKVGENPVIPRDVGESHWARGSILRAVNRGEPLEAPEE